MRNGLGWQRIPWLASHYPANHMTVWGSVHIAYRKDFVGDRFRIPKIRLPFLSGFDPVTLIRRASKRGIDGQVIFTGFHEKPYPWLYVSDKWTEPRPGILYY